MDKAQSTKHETSHSQNHQIETDPNNIDTLKK